MSPRVVDEIWEARQVLEIEAQSILSLTSRLEVVPKAIELLFSCQGKVIVTGIGKSGAIGRKVASTLNSTGTPSLFLHPAESSHGDLGVIARGDVVLAFSYGGESQELGHLLAYIARKGIPLIAVTGEMESTLAKSADVTVNVHVEKEACPMGLAPTASSTATLAMGDALAIVLLKRRGFDQEDFAEFHPGGKLGRRLLTRIKDIMHGEREIPLVAKEMRLRKVIIEMASKQTKGVTGVVDEQGDLIGVITDGDIRRLLERNENPLDLEAQSVMSRNPKTADLGELAEKALFVMEQFMIQNLFVIDRNSKTPNRPIGILHLQDLLRAKIR